MSAPLNGLTKERLERALSTAYARRKFEPMVDCLWAELTKPEPPPPPLTSRELPDKVRSAYRAAGGDRVCDTDEAFTGFMQRALDACMPEIIAEVVNRAKILIPTVGPAEDSIGEWVEVGRQDGLAGSRYIGARPLIDALAAPYRVNAEQARRKEP